ncbi:MAG: adenylosuccinate lyase [Eubacteriales bacterium]|nr:adenylosuccinate lyase [Eubacteriales bacterium]
MKNNNTKSTYVSPLAKRYSSKEMSYLFSEEKKIKTWRLLWISLAKAEKKLGLNISKEQIDDLIKYKNDINFNKANEYEKELRHDVFAHIKTYGDIAKKAKGIIHLGATSCYVGDNTDIIIQKEALLLLKSKLLLLIQILSKFCDKYKSTPTLSFTHFQPAQPTTIGKRASLWLYDLYIDFNDLCLLEENIKFLGCRGTTGTESSFLELFNGSNKKCIELNELIKKDFNFKEIHPISAQTYTRKMDYKIMALLSSIAQSSHKFSNDLRLLQHLKEIEEPFNKLQVGSSAMPYKRNPMRCERIASLSNFVMSNINNALYTASSQWFERTLDDSANRRLSISESFLATDGIINLYINILDGLVVNKKMINKHINEELPFLITENIMMNEVTKYHKDRQKIHEVIRKLSIEAGEHIKKEGKENNLIELLIKSKDLHINEDDIKKIMNPNLYIGRSKEQVEDFLNNYIKPLLKKYSKEKYKNKIIIEV